MSATNSSECSGKENEVEVSPPESFTVHSLRPEYREAEHGLYASYLQAELDKPTRIKSKSDEARTADLRPRNVALTGSYGSGKSSILSKVVADLGDRVVSVSLSTLGSEGVNHPAGDADKDPLETPAITNSIQKEIVKQLLYREKPWKVPGSRYKRIERFRHSRSFGLGIIIAGVVTVVTLATGWFGRIETFFKSEFWPVLASYGVLFGLTTIAAWGVQLIFHNRVRLEKVTSGPASVSLTDKSESFFDKYLDELVYFFEANDYDVVIFEDLDRFNDPYIFETLRELNTLLNNSKQIAPNIVTFVYAIKDSIFEQLGRLSINGVTLTDKEVQSLAVTNRTKFFDLVIPVVPFISHRSARDLLVKEIKGSGFFLEKALVDLVAKYLVDMRLIKNLHNEYGIFRAKILAPDGVKELDAQRLFAMVAYKNLYMTDFERVKDGASALDKVYADYRTLVNQQIAEANATIQRARARLQKLNSLEPRSRALGDRLEEYLTRLLRHSSATFAQASMVLAGAVELADLRTSAFWLKWLQNPQLTLNLSVGRPVAVVYYGQQNATLPFIVSLDDVRIALGDPLDLDEWRSADSDALRATIAKSTELRDFLKRASLKEVLSRPDLTVDIGGAVRSLFASAQLFLGEGLALDLLQAGYIDRNFSLYVSLYYGETVTALARNFLLHAVETNVMDENAQIGSPDEIEAMLDEAGAGIFNERSAYNIQIFDHALDRDDGRLQATLRRLSRDGQDERTFVAAYVGNGSQLDKLVTRLTPEWGGILLRLLAESSFDEVQRVWLVDIALAALSADTAYVTNAEFGRFVESHYVDLKSVSGGRPVASVGRLGDVLESSAVHFDSLRAVAPGLQPIVIAKSLYRLTADNLVAALGGQLNLSLDAIRARDENVFGYVRVHLAEYIAIVAASDDTKHTIDGREHLIAILNEIADQDPDVVRSVLDRATPAIYQALSTLDERLWSIVAGAGQLKVTATNVRSYVDKRGGLDESLAASLARASAVEGLDGVDDAERRGLAIALVNCTHLEVGKRVELVASLKLPVPLAVSELELGDADAELPGGLVAASLLEDSAAAFTALAPSGWAAQRSYMLGSTGFVGYVMTIPFTPATMERLLSDSLTPMEVKRALLLNMEAFAGTLTRGSLAALAQFSLESGIEVGASGLLRFAGGQVTAPVLVRLIDREADSFGMPALLAVLDVMPDEYRKLTRTGRHTDLPNTVEDVRLVDRLIAARQVSSRDQDPKGAKFRIFLRRKLE